jgi:hypothetical protein
LPEAATLVNNAEVHCIEAAVDASRRVRQARGELALAVIGVFALTLIANAFGRVSTVKGWWV